jgi:HlyD family secretion protein
MSTPESTDLHPTDIAPGTQRLGETEVFAALESYLIGLGLATLLTVVSFFISGTTLVWGPSIPVALAVLAIAQMGVHLVFFLHIGTGPDNVNNVMALAFGVLIVLLLLVGSLWIMGNMNRNMAPTGGIMHMPVEPVAKARAITAEGVVATNANVPVRGRVSGVIQSVACDAGMQVHVDQVCAKIDPQPFQIAVDRARATLQDAVARLEKDRADLASMKAALEHEEDLARRRTASRKAADRSRESFERAQIQTSRAEAEVADRKVALRAAEVALGATEVVIPFEGLVLSRNAEAGQTVTDAAPPLFVVAADLSVAQIHAPLSAEDSESIKVGSTATFTVEALPNQTFTGMVTKIRPAPQAGEPNATAEVVISAPNPDYLLRPGMAARIAIRIE